MEADPSLGPGFQKRGLRRPGAKLSQLHVHPFQQLDDDLYTTRFYDVLCLYVYIELYRV